MLRRTPSYALATASQAVLLVALGCTDRSSAPVAASSTALTTEPAVLAANVGAQDVQDEVTGIALDRGRSLSLRLVALRKLEEQAPDRAVATASTLALTPYTSANDEALRKNAIAVLVRSPLPAAKDALERVKKSTVEAAVLAVRLAEGGS